MATKEIKGTKNLGVVAPTLTELKSRACTLEELQAAIVQLAGIVNHNANRPDSYADIMNSPHNL